MLEPNSRNGLKAELLGSLDAAVTGDDATGLVDQHGVVEAERPDARRYLGDLLRAMRPRIATVGFELAGSAMLDC